jgi:hypothetical protein
MSTGKWNFRKADARRALQVYVEAGFPAPILKVVNGGFEVSPGPEKAETAQSALDAELAEFQARSRG